MLRLPAIFWACAVVVVAAGLIATVVAQGDEGADAAVGGPAALEQAGTSSGQSYDFACANLTIGLELLDELQHPFDLTCSFQGVQQECGSILAGAIECVLPGDFNWVCTEQGSENAYCARSGSPARDTNCTKTNDQIDCTGASEPDFTDCESSGPPPNWDCMTPAGPFHCNADTNDFACEIEGLVTPTPAPSSLRWGDVDCNGAISVRDNQALLRFVLSQPALSQTEPCPKVGQDVHVEVE